MRKMMILALAIGMFVNSGTAQEVPSAKQIMNEAFAKAKKENKNVFLIFHASWCGWCHKMDKSMQEPAVSKYFTDNYVITHLITGERDTTKDNAGAAEWLKKCNSSGKDGLPYWGIFDNKGELLADGKIRKEDEGLDKGSNTGCPASKEEVEFFSSLLKKTSKIDEEGLKKIEETFRKNDPSGR